MIAQRKKIQFSIIFKKQQFALYLVGRLGKPPKKIKSVVQLFCRKHITQQEDNIFHHAFPESLGYTLSLIPVDLHCYAKYCKCRAM